MDEVGASYIIGLGNYTGGELMIWDKDDKNPVKHEMC